MPVGKHFTGGAYLVNGWNNVEDNNSGKTVILTRRGEQLKGYLVEQLHRRS